MDWPTHRYSGRRGLFQFCRMAQSSDCLMDCDNQIRKLTRLQLMVGDVFADDLSRQMRMVLVGVHRVISQKVLRSIYATPHNHRGLAGLTTIYLLVTTSLVPRCVRNLSLQLVHHSHAQLMVGHRQRRGLDLTVAGRDQSRKGELTLTLPSPLRSRRPASTRKRGRRFVGQGRSQCAAEDRPANPTRNWGLSISSADPPTTFCGSRPSAARQGPSSMIRSREVESEDLRRGYRTSGIDPNIGFSPIVLCYVASTLYTRSTSARLSQGFCRKWMLLSPSSRHRTTPSS